MTNSASSSAGCVEVLDLIYDAIELPNKLDTIYDVFSSSKSIIPHKVIIVISVLRRHVVLVNYNIW